MASYSGSENEVFPIIDKEHGTEIELDISQAPEVDNPLLQGQQNGLDQKELKVGGKCYSS